MLDSVAALPVTAVQSAPAVAPEPVSVASQTPGSDAKPTFEHLSPSLQLDPEVGIVVIQYRSASGKIELSIPTQKQLDAYAANPSAATEGEGATTVA